MTATQIRPNQYESEVDGQLADLWTQASDLTSRIKSAESSLAHRSGAPMEWRSKHLVCTLTSTELRQHAEAVLADPTLDGRFYLSAKGSGGWTSKDEITEAITLIDSLTAQRAAVREDAKPLEDIYAARQWSRFFLVTSSAGGHIHSSMSCSTCRFDTGFAWLPELSGLTEKDAVDAHGAILCTVCFPSAPVEWTNLHELEAEAKKAEKCPGSGMDATDFSRRYQACPCCDAYPAITSNGYLRSHKPVTS